MTPSRLPFQLPRVRMLPTTKRLKQLIKVHGEFWRIIRGHAHLPAFNGEPGVLVESLDGKKHSRWIRLTDFETLPNHGLKEGE